MPLSTNQILFGVTDAKLALVLENTDTSYKTGEYIDLPDIKSIEATVKTEEKECKAGITTLSTLTLNSGYDIKFEIASIPLEVYAKINGATLEQSGTAPNQVNKITVNDKDVPNEFALACKTDYVDGVPADFHMEYVCVKGNFSFVPKSDDYWTASFTGKAYARKKKDANGKRAMLIITANESDTPIDETINPPEGV